MTLVVITCYVLDVFPLMICVPLHIDYYIPLLGVTLFIKCMLWDMCHMLAERHVVVPLWWLILCLYKKKKKGVVTTPILANGVVEPHQIRFGGGRTTPMALRGGSATLKKQNGGGRNNL